MVLESDWTLESGKEIVKSLILIMLAKLIVHAPDRKSAIVANDTYIVNVVSA